jgi:hypothetical protein
MTPAERAIVAELARLSPRAAARRINELAELAACRCATSAGTSADAH